MGTDRGAAWFALWRNSAWRRIGLRRSTHCPAFTDLPGFQCRMLRLSRLLCSLGGGSRNVAYAPSEIFVLYSAKAIASEPYFYAHGAGRTLAISPDGFATAMGRWHKSIAPDEHDEYVARQIVSRPGDRTGIGWLIRAPRRSRAGLPDCRRHRHRWW